MTGRERLPKAEKIRFIRGRLKFGEATNSAPFPSMVVFLKGRKNREDGHLRLVLLKSVG